MNLLDVYKRQLQCDFVSLQLVICKTGISCNIVNAPIEPVSYTHLDVYKRQACISGKALSCHESLEGDRGK